MNRMIVRNVVTIVVLTWLPIVAGCGSGTDTPMDLAQFGELSLPENLPVAADLSTTDEPVELPNPERVNPFQKINQPEFVSASLPMQLKGFVESDRTKAVLLIGDKISIVEENDVIGSFHIVEIRPPELVFDQNGVERRLTL